MKTLTRDTAIDFKIDFNDNCIIRESNSPSDKPQHGYNAFAADYYSDAHVTTRNFDYATMAFLSRFDLFGQDATAATVVDFGAGKGRAHEYISSIRSSYIVEIDSSIEMLRLDRTERIDAKICADASITPIRNNFADLSLSFLFDPFNTKDFMNEVRRITKDGGKFLGTLPSSNFATSARNAAGIDESSTVFTDEAGRRHMVRSYVPPEAETKQRLHESGFEFVSVYSLPCAAFGPEPSAHIIRAAAEHKTSLSDFGVVSLFIAR